MTTEELLQMRDMAEAGRIQFKERILDVHDISCELVALSNSHGGKLVIGIDDKTGRINALSYKELQETNNLLSNIASENVVPSILIDNIENVPVEGGAVVVAHIPEGHNKPYHDNKGIIWKKNGSDKRKVFDNSELAEMMQECGSFNPDEAAVQRATIDDLDADTLKEYFNSRFSSVLQKKGFTAERLAEASINEVCNAIYTGADLFKILRNLHFIRPNGDLTVSAIMLFAKNTQLWLPVMTTKCICYVGNSVGGTQFRDKVQDASMEGNLLHQYETIMAFFNRNLRVVQNESEFNTQGELEIPYTTLIELTVNALVHRSLSWKAPIRIFIFDNRVEIHSPGELPNGLTTEDVLSGISLPRNNFLFSHAIHLLPYTGAGSGIPRALESDSNIQFVNSEKLHEFIITIPRPEHDTQSVEHDTQNVEHDTQNDKHDTRNDKHDTREAKHDTPRPKITNKQRDIVNFCSVPRTRAEILARAGVIYHSKNIKTYIGFLVEYGYLEMTNPDNPNAKSQKYRKVR